MTGNLTVNSAPRSTPARCFERASMQPHEMLRDGQADTEASLHLPARILRLPKAIEYVGEEIGGDARTRVRHPDLHLGIRPAGGRPAPGRPCW